MPPTEPPLGVASAEHDSPASETPAEWERTLSQLEREEELGRKTMWPPTLAAYGPLFRKFEGDDVFKWRLLSHEFGLRWQHTPLEEKLALVETEPAPISPGWDALVAAWVDYHCYHDGIQPPDWVYQQNRVYRGFWTYFPGEMRGLVLAAMVHSPAAFLARGVWVEERELKVV